MVHDQRSALAAYIASLLSEGRVVFASEQAERTLGVGRGAFLDAAERLQRRKALIRPRQGVRRQGFWDNRRRELTEALVHQVCHIRLLHLDEASGAV